MNDCMIKLIPVPGNLLYFHIFQEGGDPDRTERVKRERETENTGGSV